MAPLWKVNLYHRDNYCCQKCGTTVNLTLHHLFPKSLYPELKTNMNNLITLCERCHQNYHNKYCKRDINVCNPVHFLGWLGKEYVTNGYQTKPKYLVKIDKRYAKDTNRIWKEVKEEDEESN